MEGTVLTHPSQEAYPVSGHRKKQTSLSLAASSSSSQGDLEAFEISWWFGKQKTSSGRHPGGMSESPPLPSLL